MSRRALLSVFLFLGLLFVLPVFGTPIRPDIKQLIKDAEKPTMPYQPARAGWNGPEATPIGAVNPAYESILAQDSPEAVRAQLLDVATPHWQTWMAFAVIIFMLRLMRAEQRKQQQKQRAPIPFPARPLPNPDEDQVRAA